jgi:hypothetical protein
MASASSELQLPQSHANIAENLAMVQEEGSGLQVPELSLCTGYRAEVLSGSEIGNKIHPFLSASLEKSVKT